MTGFDGQTQGRHRSPSLPSSQPHLQVRNRSPSVPSAHSQQSIKAEMNSQPTQSFSSGSRSGSGSALQAVELREEKGVLKAVYDPEDLRRYQEERGYVNPTPISPSAGVNQPPQSHYADPNQYQDPNATHQPDLEIIRPQSSPQFTPRDRVEFANPDEYISMARRGSLAPAHLVRHRQQEIFTPLPIPFSDTRPPYPPTHEYEGQPYPRRQFPYPVGYPQIHGEPPAQRQGRVHGQYHAGEQSGSRGPGW